MNSEFIIALHALAYLRHRNTKVSSEELIKLSDLAQALQQPLTKSGWRSGALNTYCMVATGMGTVVDTLEASLNEVCMQSLSQITIEDISQQLIAIENHKNKEE